MGTQGSYQHRRAKPEAPGHARMQRTIGALADGELSAQEARAVEEHVRGCDRCRRELRLQQDVSRALARQRVPPASSGLRRAIESIGVPSVELVAVDPLRAGPRKTPGR